MSTTSTGKRWGPLPRAISHPKLPLTPEMRKPPLPKTKSGISHSPREKTEKVPKVIPQMPKIPPLRLNNLSRQMTMRLKSPSKRRVTAEEIQEELALNKTGSEGIGLSALSARQNANIARFWAELDAKEKKERVITERKQSGFDQKVTFNDEIKVKQRDSETHRRDLSGTLSDLNRQLAQLTFRKHNISPTKWYESPSGGSSPRKRQLDEGGIFTAYPRTEKPVSPRKPIGMFSSIVAIRAAVEAAHGVGGEKDHSKFEEDVPLPKLRSTREVENDVAMKLHILRNDSEKRQKLQRRLDLYEETARRKRNALKTGKNFIALNKVKTPREYSGGNKLDKIRENARKVDRSIENAIVRRREKEEERQRRVLELVQRREMRKQKEKEEKERILKEEKISELQNKLASMISGTARMNVWIGLVKQHRDTHILEEVKAARKIQRWFRRFYYASSEHRFVYHKAMIMTWLPRAVRRWKLSHKIRSASVVLQFLRDVQELTKIARVIKKFRIAVVKIQKFIRNTVPRVHIQLQLLSSQWDRVQAPLLAQKNSRLKRKHAKEQVKQRALENRLEYKSLRKGRSQTIAGAAEAKFVAFIPSVTEDIKMKVLIKDFNMRRREHLKELDDWRAKCEAVRKRQELHMTKQMLTGGGGDKRMPPDLALPPKPTFDWRVDGEYMGKLVEAGIEMMANMRAQRK